METLNSLLEDEDLDTYEVNEKINISDIKALRLHLNTPFKCPFISVDGSLKFQGSLIHKANDQTICLLACTNFNTRVYFGKGFLSIKDFQAAINIKTVENC